MKGKKKTRYERLKDALTSLAEGVQHLIESESWIKFLNLRRKFRNYSFGNCVLIYVQSPDATLVAGLKKWKSLGRKIKRGEKGIRILVPFFKKEPVDDVLSELDESGRSETYIKKLAGFGVGYVYDISQTEGAPLPDEKLMELEEPLYCNRKLTPEELYEKLKGTVPVPVEEVPPKSTGWHGSYCKEKGLITLNQEDSVLTKIITLLHEIAHYHSPSDLLENRKTAEYIAESVSCIICREYLGLDNSKEAIKYLASYGGDARKLCKITSQILGVAEKISEGLIVTEYGKEVLI